MGFLTVNTFIELTCFFISLFTLYRDPNPLWKGIMVYLFLYTLGEIVGVYLKHIYLSHPTIYHSNAWWYNMLLILQFTYISFFFRELFKKEKKIRVLIMIMLGLISIMYVVEILRFGIFTYANGTKIGFSVVFVVFCLYYYYSLIKNEIYINLLVSAEFWWVTGCLFYYFGSTVCNLTYPKLTEILISSGKYLSYYIFNVLNIILYGCWGYSFFCRKWQLKNLRT